MMTERDGLRPKFDYDCLIVGGGPAGLTAAIYLARFHLSVLVVDAGKSRAALIRKRAFRSTLLPEAERPS